MNSNKKNHKILNQALNQNYPKLGEIGYWGNKERKFSESDVRKILIEFEIQNKNNSIGAIEWFNNFLKSYK